MTSLPTIQDHYKTELDNNNSQAMSLLDQLFPELQLPYEDIYQILSFLEETKVNAQILPRVIRGVHNLIIGTGKGQVIVHVSGQIINVQTRETDQDLKASI